jgi:sugar phosphate isomerase/epimerase
MIEQNTLTTADIARGDDSPREQREENLREDKGNAPLLPVNEAQDLRSKWERTQAGFVDEPRNAVEEADQLVASAMKRLAEVFADERAKLEHEWDRGDSVSTEDLRLALRRYRSFFDRLLSV